MISLVLFGISAVIGSGVLFSHKRALTYLACAGMIFEAEFLVAAFIRRVILHGAPGPTFYLVAGIVFLTIWVSLYKHWKSPYATAGSGKRDGFVAIALIALLAIAYPIITTNGYQGDAFIIHGFYNGDTATFVSLVNKSFSTLGLVHENPFAANGTLEYPSLLHGAFADFLSLTGVGINWLRFLGLISFVQIIITIPLFFLLWDTVFPEPKNEAELWFGIVSRNVVYAGQTVLTLFAISLSLDSYTYPQSHFFLLASFLGCIALLAKAATSSNKAQLRFALPGVIIALVLLLANTVTGTAAIGLAGTLVLIRIFDRKRSIAERGIYLALGFGLLAFLHAASIGRTSLTHLHFSASAAGDMMRAGLPYLFVIGASLYALSRKQYIAASALLVGLLSFITFFLSDRNIVTENASRFLYHGFIIGFVLLLGPALQYIYFLRRELLLTSRPLSERIVGWVGVIMLAATCFLPMGVSAASTYSNLLYNDSQTISLTMREALWWIDSHSQPLDVVITSPSEPFSVPFFTSKAMLRAQDYWLSPQDDTTQNLVAAFAGDAASQQKVLQQGTFILLTPEQAALWDVSKLKKVFQSPDAVVYLAH